MAEEADIPEALPERRPLAWPRRLLALFLGLVGAALLVVIVLDSPIGHRFVVERLAQLAPASGLRISIGRIEGSLYGKARLRDVALSDPQGVFARIPEAELDWRPFNWFRSGLDVRKLVARRGTLLRYPKLLPGDPDAPILPKFDIRIDHFEIDRGRLAKGVIGKEQRIDLLAKVDIRQGRALVKVDGRMGGGDRVHVLLDAMPDGDRFDIDVDYAAPKGGFLAGLAGVQRDLALRVAGNGSWRKWDGTLVARQNSALLAAFKLTNRSGVYGFLGQVTPDDLLTGTAKRVAGKAVSLSGEGTLAESVLKGRLGVIAAAFRGNANGVVDLDGNSFENFRVTADLTDPAIAGPDLRLEGGNLIATLNGDFQQMNVVHSVRVNRLRFGAFGADQLTLDGKIIRDGQRWTLPMVMRAARLVTGDPATDRRLVNPRVTTRLAINGTKLRSDVLAIDMQGLAARLTLAGDLAKGGFGVAGPIVARGLALPNLGLADANANIVASFGNAPWRVKADVSGRMARVDNATLTSIAGTNIRFSANVTAGGGQPILVERAKLDASLLTLSLSGRRLVDGRTTITGSGRHKSYGPFTVDASMGGQGLRAELVFANPLPAAGLRDVRIALSPIADGFRIETKGASTLGPFAGILNLFSRPGGPTRIDIASFDIAKTSITGGLTLGSGAVSGKLNLTGGGVVGTVALAPRSGGQGFDLDVTANNASFSGTTPVAIGNAHLVANGYFADGRSTISGTLDGRSLSYGTFHLSSLSAKAQIADGRGTATATLSGRQGNHFNLQLSSEFEPKRVTLVARGDLAGRRITMPRRAVLTSEDGGWRLAPTQVNFGGGRIVAGGLLGDSTAFDIALAEMPLSVLDIALADLGFGGTVSGLVHFRSTEGAAPTGIVQVMVTGLSRSGLVLTSRPMDLALVGNLTAGGLQARAVAREDGEIRGQLQARISGMPPSGGLAERLAAGSLFAQLRYDGPADALWRLAAIDAFDLTGPVSIAADVTGTLRAPVIRGSLSSTELRLQSSLTGTDISKIAAQGRFSGSRLELTSFTGEASNGGKVSGTGMFDLANLGTRGPAMDLRIATRNARVLARSDMAASVTGPIRIVSDGLTGTIAGRVELITARWQLGNAEEQARLPVIKTTEINGIIDTRQRGAASTTWRYMIDTEGNNRIDVRGMGLDSEWSADIRLRGTVEAPTIVGTADLVRGSYAFAGKRFQLTRGRISFNGNSPPDPQLDIQAEAQETGLTARVTIGGTASQPDISFTSVPAMPEEELLSRLLFGSSISDISPAEAIQLGAALASLQGGGGGLDPVNKLRSAIGLDRLRIIGANEATGQETSIAAGMYISRRLYAEIVTDGRGYSATQLEFRITNWLSLLATVSTIGRQSINVKASKDY
ncbi:MAG: translocation/assembly module TamB domain-containing protein [Novosphingobium sp.]